MRRLLLIVLLGLIGSGIVLCFAPWSLLHPNDPSLVLAHRYAPLWSRPAETPYAKVELDAVPLALGIGAVWAVVIGVDAVLRQSNR
jgi:hypothetical protein